MCQSHAKCSRGKQMPRSIPTSLFSSSFFFFVFLFFAFFATTDALEVESGPNGERQAEADTVAHGRSQQQRRELCLPRLHDNAIEIGAGVAIATGIELEGS